jgi:hypothetical protein
MAKAANTERMVMIPRAVYGQYAGLPWDDLVAAAERGENGVTFRTGLEGYALMRG